MRRLPGPSRRGRLPPLMLPDRFGDDHRKPFAEMVRGRSADIPVRRALCQGVLCRYECLRSEVWCNVPKYRQAERPKLKIATACPSLMP